MKSTDDLIRELKEFERKKDAFFREKSGALDNKKNEKFGHNFVVARLKRQEKELISNQRILKAQLQGRLDVLDRLRTAEECINFQRIRCGQYCLNTICPMHQNNQINQEIQDIKAILDLKGEQTK
ncbi:MAG TPA: hypothetical protein VI911_07475 [Patescibacteria group bacterium]|nr:hypothetical protein [Patescibacteria group bacterium]